MNINRTNLNEESNTQPRRHVRRAIKQFIVLVFALSFSFLSFSLIANPEGGQVSAGSATITNPNPTTVQINQASDKAVIDWKTYNIAEHETTQYVQPSVKSIMLNRIDPTMGASTIRGALNANGQIILINPAGILFTSTASVDVAGLLATTANISNEDFMSGKFRFVQSPLWNGAVINDGKITIRNEGIAALVAPGVENNGVIMAKMGKVVLASGTEYTIDFYGDQMIQFGVNSEVSKPAVAPDGRILTAAVSNTGKIIANGGKVLLTAKTAGSILDHSINMSGRIEANSVSQRGGSIILSGGESGIVKVSGKMVAMGKHRGQKGGTVKVLGDNIQLVDNASINVSGKSGGGTILVGGNFYGAGIEQNATNTYVAQTVKLNADSIYNNNGGNIAIWSNGHTEFYGSLSARGGLLGGNGGFIETSGHYLNVANAMVDTRAPAGLVGTWLLDPTNIYIALNQANATTAGMSGTDTSANTASSGTFAGSGAIQDSLLTTGNLTTALNSSNVIVTTTNPSGTGIGNITIVDPFSWAGVGNSLTLTAANNILINGAITTGTVASSLILNAAGSVTQTAAIGGAGNLVQQGAGTVNLSQANTYSGATTVNAGGITLSGAGTALNSTGFTVNYGANLTLDNTTTNNTDRIAGTLTLNGGEFVFKGSNTAATNASESVGQLNLTTGNSTITAVSGTGGSTTLTFASVARSVGAAALFRGTNLGSTAGAGNTNIIFTTSTGLGLVGGNTTQTNKPIVPFAFGDTTAAGTGSSFVTYNINPANNTANTTGIRPLSVSTEYALNTLSTGNNINLTTGTTSATTNIGINSLLLTGGTLNYGINAVTVVLSSGALAQTAGNITSSTSTSRILSFGGVEAKIFSTGSLGIGSSVTGTAGFTKSGSGTVSLNTQAKAFTGGITINSGTLALGVTNALASQATTVRAPGTLSVTSGGAASVTTLALESGSTSGASVTTGVGTLTLGGDITQIVTGTGATGALISGNLALGASRQITVADGVASNDLTISALISGATFGITKQGAGLLALSNNANTYTGQVVINAGTLSATWINNANGSSSLGTGAANSIINIGSTGVLKFVGSGAGNVTNRVINLTGSGGTIDASGSVALSLTGGITGNTFGLVLTGTGSGTESGVIGTTTGTVTKSGSGTWTLSNTNTYTGTTTLNGGTLVASAAGALGPAAGGNIIIQPTSGTAILDLTAIGSLTNTNVGTNIQLNSSTGTAQLNTSALFSTAKAISLTGSNNVFSVAANTTTLSGVLSGTGFTKAGTGTLTLSNINTYTGATILNAGTLTASIAGALGPAAGGNIIIQPTSGTAILDLTAIGSLTNTNVGTNIQFDSSTGTAQLNISTSFITAKAISLTGANNVFSVAAANKITVNGAITGTGGLTKTGAGILALGGTSNANTYQGVTNITAGSLEQWVANIFSANSQYNLSNVSGVMLNLNNLASSIGSLTGGGATGGNVSLGSVVLTIGNDNTSPAAYAGIISGSATSGITKIGTGTLTLSGTNTYTGSTTINNGTLVASVAGALGPVGGGTIFITPSASSTALLDLTGIASLTNTSFTNIQLNSSAASSTAQLNTSAAFSTAKAISLTGTNNVFSVAANTTTLSGAISGTGGMTKIGAGTLTLSGTNTYTGATNINEGTLSIASTGGLGGTGSGGSATTIAPSAILDLNFTGTLANSNTITFAGIDYNAGPTLNFSGNNITLNNPITLGGAYNVAYIAGNGAGTQVIAGGSGITASGLVDLYINLPNASITLPAISQPSGGILSVIAGGAVNGSNLITLGPNFTDTLSVTANTGINLSNVGNSAIQVALTNNTSGNIIYNNNRDFNISARNDAPNGAITVVNASGGLNVGTEISAMMGVSSNIFLQTAGVLGAVNNIESSGSVTLIGTGVTTNLYNLYFGTINGLGGVTINANTGLFNNNGGSITNSGTNAAINITADTMSLVGGTITAGSGAVNLTSSTLNRAITIGGGLSGLGLSNSKLNTITTSGVLTIGDAAHTGTLSADGAVSGITNPSGAWIFRTNNGAITLDNAVTTPNDLSLITTAAVNGAGALTIGTAGANSLTVNAGAGINLSNVGNLANAVTLTNSTTGNIFFRNNRNMTLAASNSAAGGTLSVVNATGTLDTSGAITTGSGAANITLQSPGTITINNPVTAGGTGNVSLTSNNQITQNGSGVITGSLLTTNSGTGTLLNFATNAVTSFNATNSTSGDISLLNNTGTLSITGITDNAATSSTVNITNSNVAGNISVTGALNAGTNAVNLTASNGQISQTGGGVGVITGGLLTTVSKLGTYLNNNTNVITGFNATNTSLYDIFLLASASTLSITGITDPASSTTVSIRNNNAIGNIAVIGAFDGGIRAAIQLTSDNGQITQNSSGVITGTLLTTNSATGTLLNSATNAVTSFNATNRTSGDISLTNNTGTLSITGITDNAATSSAVNIINSNVAGNISLTGALNAGTNAINLTASNGQISQNSSGIITSGLLTTNSKTGTLLNTATNAVTSFNATNSTSGDISLTNNIGTLSITGITDNAATSSAVNITNSNVAGNISVAGALNAGTNAVNLTASNGQISQVGSGVGVITGGLLTTISKLGTYLNDNTNVVTGFNATNTSLYDIFLRTSASTLSITGITDSASSTTISIRNINALGNIAVIGALNGGTYAAVQLTSDNGQITQNSSGVITGTLLTTNSATGTLLNSATNAVTSFNATNRTSGNISLTNNTGTLSITGITDNAATSSAVNITNSNLAGNISLTGALNAGTNAINLTANNGQILQNSSGIITSGLLTTNSKTGALLNTAMNAVTNFNATNSTNGNINLANNVGTLTITGIAQNGSGNVAVTNTGALTTSGLINSASGSVTLNATNAAITLNSNITANAAGNSIVLAGGSFINNVGGSVLNPGIGSFLVWSGNPANDTRGGLTYNFKQYNAVYGSSTVLGTGNGFLYTIAPTITTSLIGTVSKTYNANNIATLTAGNYGSSSGAIDGDTVTLNNSTSGTYGSINVGTNINVAATGLAIASATNGAVTVYGYQVTPVNANIGVITAAPITISSNAGQTKVYGNDDPASAATAYSVTSGAVFGADSLTGSMGRVAGENIGLYNFTQNTVTVSDGNSGNNYAVTFDGSTNKFQITALALSGSIANQTKVYGANDPTISGIGVALNGVVNRTISTLNGNVVVNDTGNVSTTLNTLTRIAGEMVSGAPYDITGVTFNALSGSAAGNYTLPDSFASTPTLSITKANLTGSITNQSKVYGADDPSLGGINVNLTGLINNNAIVTWNGNVSIDDSALTSSVTSLTRQAGEDIGIRNITAGVFSAPSSNYNAPSFTGAPTLSITKANLTGSIANQSKVYGADDPALVGIGVTLGGVINNPAIVTWNGNVAVDDSGNVATTLASLTRDVGENVASYNITAATFNALTGSAIGNYNAPSYSGAPTLSITAADLTGSIANQSKVYGADDPSLGGINVNLAGLINNNAIVTWNGNVSIDDSALTSSVTSLTRQAGENVGTRNITAGVFSAPSSNYNAPSLTGEPTLSITKANLTGSIANQSKVYGADDPVLAGIGVILSGVIDNLALVTWNGNVEVYDAGNVATTLASLTRDVGENVASYNITAATFNALTGSAIGNYNEPVFAGSPALSISAANLTGSIANQTKVYGANDPSLAGIDVTLNGIINRTVSTWNGNVAVDDSGNVATTLASLTRNAGENVASYNITAATFNALSGSAAGNYNISSLTGEPILSITKADLTGLIANQSKTYGSDDPALAGIGVILSGVIDNPALVTWNGNVEVYDSGNVATTLASLIRDAGENVASYNITGATFNALTGSAIGNYNAPSFSSAPTLSITKANLAGSIANQSKVYGANDPSLAGINVNLSGLINNNAIVTWNGNVSIDDSALTSSVTSLTRQVGENVGTRNITASVFSAPSSNYNAPSFSGEPTLSISAANLTGSIENQSKVYGANDPALAGIGVTLGGIINNPAIVTWNGNVAVDDSGNVATTLASLTRDAGENVASYNITAAAFNALTGSAAGNYNAPSFSGAPTLSITAANLTGSIANQSKVYGANDPSLAGISVNLSGLINNNAIVTWNGNVAVDDSGNVATTLASLTRDAGENVASYNITAATFNALTGSAAGNYNAPSFSGAPTLSITAANLTGSIANQSKVYGANDPALAGIGVTLAGIINNPAIVTWNGNVAVDDSGNVATTLASLTRDAGENVASYNITAATFNALTGSAAGNYNAPSFSGAPTLSITAANLTGSIENQSKVYGANDPALSGIGVTLNGIINRTVSTWNGNVAVNDSGNVATTLASLTRDVGENVASYNITAAAFNVLTGSAAGNYNAPSFSGAPTLSISAANLTGSIANQSKVYGANDPALSGIGVTLNGIINRTVSTWNGNVAVDDSGNVATILASLTRDVGENVASYNITAAAFNVLTGSAAGNYNAPSFSGAPTLSISAANLTGSIANQSKVYGANDPSLAGINVNLSGLINNNAIVTWNGNVSIDDSALTSSVTSLTRQAGENVGTRNITAGIFSAPSSNYNAPSFSGAPTLSITAANLTGSIANQSKVYGANDPSLAGISVNLSGLINNNAIVTWNGNVSIDDSALTSSVTSLTRQAGENVGTRNITAGIFSAPSSNYNALSFSGAPTLSISAANLTGSIANQSKVYGANDPALAGIGVTLGGIINNPAIVTWNGNVAVNDSGNVATTLASLTRDAGENVASYNITAATFNALTGSAAGNYNAPSFSGAPTLSISAANLTGSIANQSKVYGANDPALSGIGVTLNGIINRTISTWNGNVSINDTNNLSSSVVSLSRNPGENIGNYAITVENFAPLSGSAANNYSFPTTSSGSLLTITPITLTATVPNQTKVYGTNDPLASSISATLSGVIQGVAVTDWNNQQTIINDNVSSTLASYARASGENVGTYAITTAGFNPLTGTGAGNYIAPSTFGGSPIINITQAPLTISAIATSKVYGSNDPVFTFNSSGFINAIVDGVPISDNASNSLTGALSRQLLSQTDENVGLHAITQGTLSAQNYSITYNANILTITKAPLTINANATTKVYGTADPSFTYTPVGLINGLVDGIAINDTNTITGALNRVVNPSTENVGSYSILQGTIQGSNNYNLSYVGNNLQITPAFLTISGVLANNKLFDGNTSAILNTNNAILSGVLSFDIGNVSIAGGGFGLFARANVGNNIPVTATSIPIIGGASGNYALIMPSGLSADILPTPIPEPAPTPTESSSPVLDGILQPIVQNIMPLQMTQSQDMNNKLNQQNAFNPNKVVIEYVNTKSATGTLETNAKKCTLISPNIEICN